MITKAIDPPIFGKDSFQFKNRTFIQPFATSKLDSRELWPYTLLFEFCNKEIYLAKGLLPTRCDPIPLNAGLKVAKSILSTKPLQNFIFCNTDKNHRKCFDTVKQ